MTKEFLGFEVVEKNGPEEPGKSSESCCHSVPDRKNSSLAKSIVLAGVIVAAALVYVSADKNPKSGDTTLSSASSPTATSEESILPAAGVVLPVKWGDLGREMVKTGVIDGQQFEALYAQRGGLSVEEKQWLSGSDNGKVRITVENAPVLLNLLWAFGLGNKNAVLEFGPMQDPKYGGAGRFASTGGWTLAKGKAMDHYSKHSFVVLTKEQQAMVERVSGNVYRPCCGNPTSFPDCNHGMAMLGLLELMASQGVSESEMYRVALAVNSFWFPDNYSVIAKAFKQKGVAWQNVDPKEVLGAAYSSAAGFNQVLSQVGPSQQKQGGSGCGVSSAPAQQPKKSSGCGV